RVGRRHRTIRRCRARRRRRTRGRGVCDVHFRFHRPAQGRALPPPRPDRHPHRTALRHLRTRRSLPAMLPRLLGRLLPGILGRPAPRRHLRPTTRTTPRTHPHRTPDRPTRRHHAPTLLRPLQRPSRRIPPRLHRRTPRLHRRRTRLRHPHRQNPTPPPPPDHRQRLRPRRIHGIHHGVPGAAGVEPDHRGESHGFGGAVAVGDGQVG